MFSYQDFSLMFGSAALNNVPLELVAHGVSTDTRSLKAGDVFVALRGESFDAHSLLAQARERGAVCVIVEYIPEESLPAGSPCIIVKNTLSALGTMARYHRRRFRIPVVAIAGSAGKTSTKELTASVLAQKFTTLKTEGNFNNQIGVPLTLLRLRVEHECAVVEIGTNEPGEIEILCAIAEPTHGVITNIGKEHLEKLIDLDGVEREETALFGYLAQHEGTAIVNADDERVARHAPPHCIGYTLQGNAIGNTLGNAESLRMITATATMTEAGLPRIEGIISQAESESQPTPFVLQVQAPGMSSAYNALAACCIGNSLGVSMADIAHGILAYKPQAGHVGYGRLVIEHRMGYTLLNDCYNANPLSMYSALATLKDIPATGHRIAVLGDMRELGTTSFDEHCTLLRALADDTMIAHIAVIGSEMARAVEHIANPRIMLCADYAECVAFAQPLLHSGAVLLVKGSRGIALEHVIAQLPQ